MKPASLIISVVLIAHVTSLNTSQVTAADKLSDILSEAKWDDIIGTWVDTDTKGENLKLTFAWKLEDRVIEVTSKAQDRETVALMGVNGKNGEVYHMGADSTGTSSLGKWEVDEQGDAILGIVYTTADGQEGTMSIRYHREDKDTTTMTIELPEPISVKLIRVKPKK